MRAPSQPFDAITAFAVPNPDSSSQKRSVFSGSGARRVAPAADHPAYFGLAKVNSLTLSSGLCGREFKAGKRSRFAGRRLRAGTYPFARRTYWKRSAYEQ